MLPPAPTPDVGAADSQVGAAPRRERRAFAWGLGISVVLHVLALVVYPLLMDRLPVEADRASPDEPELVERGMQVLALEELPDEPDPEDDPEELPTETVVPVPVPPPVGELEMEAVEDLAIEALEVEPPAAEERRHIAERLRPQTPDARLWAPLEADYMELTDVEKAQLLLYGQMQDWNDSMAVAAALSERATDWTYTDDDGRRWGLSRGELHLGDFSIPLPFSFGAPPPPGSVAAQRQWAYEDLARGAAAQQIREIWSERAREIRRRMDEDRNRQQGSGGGGG